jgi:hypothetical protein
MRCISIVRISWQALDPKIIALHDYFAATITDIHAALKKRPTDHGEGEGWEQT